MMTLWPVEDTVEEPSGLMVAFMTEPLLFRPKVAPERTWVKLKVDPLPAEMVRTTRPLPSVNSL